VLAQSSEQIEKPGKLRLLLRIAQNFEIVYRDSRFASGYLVPGDI
jgi:hypothetical protein